MNKFDEMRSAIEEAEVTLRVADNLADKMARVLIGRLRKVTSYGTLKALKRELAEYDSHKRRWKS